MVQLLNGDFLVAVGKQALQDSNTYGVLKVRSTRNKFGLLHVIYDPRVDRRCELVVAITAGQGFVING